MKTHDLAQKQSTRTPNRLSEQKSWVERDFKEEKGKRGWKEIMDERTGRETESEENREFCPTTF